MDFVENLLTYGDYDESYRYDINDIGKKPLNEFNFEQQAVIVGIFTTMNRESRQFDDYKKTVGEFRTQKEPMFDDRGIVESCVLE